MDPPKPKGAMGTTTATSKRGGPAMATNVAQHTKITPAANGNDLSPPPPVPADHRAKLTLERVLGITALSNAMMAVNPVTGELAYAAGCIVVIYNLRRDKQVRYYRVEKSVSCLCFSPSGQYLAIGEKGYLPSITVWDGTDGTLCAELQMHKFGIACMAFSRDDHSLLSVGLVHDQRIYVWDLGRKSDTGQMSVKVSATAQVHEKVLAVDFCQAGNFFVTVGERHFKFWFLDEHDQVLVTGFKVNGIPEMQHRDAVMSTKSDAIFTSVGCGYGSCKLKTFAVTSDGTLCSFGASCIMERLVSLEATSGKVISVTESYVAVGASSGVARLFDPATLEYRATMPFPPAMGAANESLQRADTSLHPDRSHRYPATIGIRLTGLHAIVLYSDRSMFVYSVANLDNIQVYRSFLFHSGSIRDLKIAGQVKGVTTRGKLIYCNDPQSVIAKGGHMVPNGTFITCSDDNTLRFWHLDLHKPSATQASRFSDDDSVVFSSNAIERRPWKHPLSQEMLRLVYHDNEADFMSEDGIVLGATCSSFETIDVHSPSVDTGLANGLRVVAIHPNQTEVTIGDKEGKITVLHLPSGERVAEIPAHRAEVHCIAYGVDDSYNQSVSSTQGKFLMASGGRDRLIHMYSCSKDHTVLDTLENHSGAVMALHFTRDGKKILSCGADKNVVFAEIHADGTVKQYNSLSMMGGKIYDMVLTSDDEYLVTSCNNRLDIHHVSTCNHIKTHHVGEQHHIAICPANYCVAMSGSLSDKTIHIVDISTGDTLADASGHGESITSIQFTPDCRRLVSTSSDGCIFVWRLSEDIQRAIKSRLPRLSETHDSHPYPPTKAVVGADQTYSLLPPPPPVAPISGFVESSANEANSIFFNHRSVKEIKNVVLERDSKTTPETMRSNDSRAALKNEVNSELQGRWKGKAPAVPGPMAKIPMEDWMRTRETAKKTVHVGAIDDGLLFVSTELIIDRSQTPDWAKTVKPDKNASPSSEISQQQVVIGKWRSRAEEKANMNENWFGDKPDLPHANRPKDEKVNTDHFNLEDDKYMRSQQRQLGVDEKKSSKDNTDGNGKCSDSLSGGLLNLSVGNMDFQLHHSVESPGSLASEREHLEKRKKQIQTANAVAAMNLKLSQLGLIKPTNGKLSDINECEHDTAVSCLADEHRVNQTGHSHNLNKPMEPEGSYDTIGESDLQLLNASSAEGRQSDVVRADIPLEMFESIEVPHQIRTPTTSDRVDESLSAFTQGFMVNNSGSSRPNVDEEDQFNDKDYAHVDQSLSSFSNGYSVSDLAGNRKLGLDKPVTECELDSVIPSLVNEHPRYQTGYPRSMIKTATSGFVSESTGVLNSDALHSSDEERRENSIRAEIPLEMFQSIEGPLHVKIRSQDPNPIHIRAPTSPECVVGLHRVDESLSSFTHGFIVDNGGCPPVNVNREDQDNEVYHAQVDQSLSSFSNGYLVSKSANHAIEERDGVDMSMSAFTTGYGVVNPSKHLITTPNEYATSLSSFTGGFQTHECSPTFMHHHQSENHPHADDGEVPVSMNSSMSSFPGRIPSGTVASSLSNFTKGFNSDGQVPTCSTSIASLMNVDHAEGIAIAGQVLEPNKSLSSFTLGYSASTTSESIRHHADLPIADTETVDATIVAAFPDNPVVGVAISALNQQLGAASTALDSLTSADGTVPPLPPVLPILFEMLDATKKRLNMSLDAISHERAQSDYMPPPAHGRTSRSSKRADRMAQTGPYQTRPNRYGGHGAHAKIDYEDEFLPIPTPAPTGGGRRVYVGNLPFSVKWQDLKDHMKQAGDVEHANVLEVGGRSKGWGIVSYTNEGDARRAITMLNDSELDGRKIFVREDREVHPIRQPQGRCRVYVGNLSWHIKWQDLKDHMKQAGNVTHADVLEEASGRSKGCGLVEYSTPEEARRAIATLNDSQLDGRVIFVREDRETEGGSISKIAKRATHGTPVSYDGPPMPMPLSFGSGYEFQSAPPPPPPQYYTHGNAYDQGRSFDMGRPFDRGHNYVEPAPYVRPVSFDRPNSYDRPISFERPSSFDRPGPFNRPSSFDRPNPYDRPNAYDRGSYEGRQLYVGNLPWDVTWQGLKDLFRTVGDVERVEIAEHPDGRSRGFATVRYRNPADAMEAIGRLNGAEINGRRVEVRLFQRG